ncbi:MAG: helix-turn-helix domain-containing protein [Deltaproteobacteria bacterium]|nr:helix-turn-helix domain-containing protein [Deltaproteobacteria bacterium]
MIEKEFLSVKEVAEKLGVVKDTIYRLIRAGELPSHQVGRAVRIRWGDVEVYLERGSEKARENLLRKRANRAGYSIRKSRVRNPHLHDQGGYMLVNNNINEVVLGGDYDGSLDDIEDFLREA